MCDLLRRVQVACLNVTWHARLLPCYMWCVTSDEYFCNAKHLLIRSLQVRLALLGTFNGNFIHLTSMLVQFPYRQCPLVFQCRRTRTLSTVSTVIHARWRLYRLHGITKRCNKVLSVTLLSRFGILPPSIISLTFSCILADLIPAQYAKCAILNRASSEKLTLASKY